jgi:membrane dipeptidase
MRCAPVYALLFAAIPALAWGQNSASPTSTMTKTKALTPEAVHRSAIVIDTHADTPQRFLDENSISAIR